MNNKKILIDAHIHTSGISHCSRVPAPKLIEVCRKDELGGIVLTNHYKSGYIHNDFRDWCKRYVEEYYYTKELGEKEKIKVFFGVEVTPVSMPKNDFTIYGLTTDEVLNGPEMYNMSLEELCDYVHSNNALIYHAHPFRNTTPVNGKLIDGTEINCHPLYRTCEEKRVREFADEFGLRLLCGSDYHGDTYKAHCGVWVPEDTETTEDFVEYIRKVIRPELTVAPDPDPDMTIAPGTGRPPRSLENK